MTPQEKFVGQDLRRVRPEELETAEDCGYVMSELDKHIGQLESELRESREKIRGWDQQRKRHMVWHYATTNDLKEVKLLRTEVQERRGLLSKVVKASVKKAMDKDSERRFIIAARGLLDKETYLKIWEVANRNKEEP